MAGQWTRVRFGGRGDRVHPLLAVALRVGLALFIVAVNWAIVVLEAGDYTDSHDGHVSVVDALYYTTVTLTTTGYGDITPITTTARLINALVVTPMRLLFVVLLVGTTLRALTRDSRDEFRLARWRKRMRDHTIVLGYGTKGRNAIRALTQRGASTAGIVVVDSSGSAIAAAAAAGHTAVLGSASDDDVLRQALVDRASTVIVALDRDDSAILATLMVRRLAPAASIIAAAREADNADLLRQSGASSVIVSSETAGRLLGLASGSPQTVDVVEDLLSFGDGLDLMQRPVRPEEAGKPPTGLEFPVLAVVRDGRILPFDSPAATLRAGDQIVYADTAAHHRATGRTGAAG
jgi:voltage-gated potassium channel